MNTTTRRTLLSFVALLALLGGIAGCGYLGIAGVVWRLAEPSDDKPNLPPTAESRTAPGLAANQFVTIRYELSDPENNPANVELSYSLDGGATYIPTPTELQGLGSDGTSDLDASPSGTPHLFMWNAPADVTGHNVAVRFRVLPFDGKTGLAGGDWVSSPFVLFADAPPLVVLSDPTGLLSGNVPLSFTLADPEGNPADITPEYSIDGGSTWAAASLYQGLGFEGLLGLPAAAGGTAHVLRWSAFIDLSGVDRQVIFRITPTDAVSSAIGPSATTHAFSLNNTRPHTVAGRGMGPMGNLVSAVFDAAGVLYFCEDYGHRVWALNPTTLAQTVAGADLNPGQLRVVAGTGTAGYNADNLPGPQSSLNGPQGLAVDAAVPPNVFVADALNHRVRRIDGTSGFITTICGTGSAGTNDDCPAFLGQLDTPGDVATDIYGNIYIADTGNHALRVVNLGFNDIVVADATITSGHVKAIAGQLGSGAGFSGDGSPASGSTLWSPTAIAVDPLGNIFVCDGGNNRVRAVNAGVGVLQVGLVLVSAMTIDTVAGGGTVGFTTGDADPLAVQFGQLSGIFLDTSSNLFFTDETNHILAFLNASHVSATSVGSITVPAGRAAVVAGTPGLEGDTGDGADALLARLSSPCLPALSPSRIVALPDPGNGRMRLYHPGTSGTPALSFAAVSIPAGAVETGILPDQKPVGTPHGIDMFGTLLYGADTAGNRIFSFDANAEKTTYLAGSGQAGASDGPRALATFSGPYDVAVDPSGTAILVADTGNDCLRIINIGGNRTLYGISVNAGDVATITPAAGLSGPCGIALAKPGRTGNLYVADTGNNRIVRVSPTGGLLSLVAGDGTGIAGFINGLNGTARFNAPKGIAVNSTGNILVVADTGNNALRLINLSSSDVVVGFGAATLTIPFGQVRTLAGDGTADYDGDGILAWNARLHSPANVEMDLNGNVYLSDTGNHRLRKITFVTGIISTLTGTGTAGFNGDGVPSANTWIHEPRGLALDSSQALYFADSLNGRVRRFLP